MTDSPVKILVNLLRRKGMEYFNRYYGVYYGFVLENYDPLNLDRLYLYIPEVNGPAEKGIWAMPLGFYSGKGYGMSMIPNIKDQVYVFYRFGNPEFPMWIHGGFKNYDGDPGYVPPKQPESGKPTELTPTTTHGIKFPQGVAVTVEDVDGESKIILHHPSNHEISITKDQITIKYNDEERLKISDGEITMNDGNNGGLVNFYDLKLRLQTIETILNTHTHYGVTSGNSMSGGPSAAIDPSGINLLEDTKVKH